MAALHEVQVGQVAQMISLLEELRDELRRGVEWGGVGDLEQIAWAVNGTGEYAYDGTFKSIGIWNLAAVLINVSFTPSGARTSPLFSLSARGFIILPYRGTTVSVGGVATAGSALVTPFEQPQPANGGTF